MGRSKRVKLDEDLEKIMILPSRRVSSPQTIEFHSPWLPGALLGLLVKGRVRVGLETGEGGRGGRRGGETSGRIRQAVCQVWSGICHGNHLWYVLNTRPVARN